MVKFRNFRGRRGVSCVDFCFYGVVLRFQSWASVLAVFHLAHSYDSYGRFWGNYMRFASKLRIWRGGYGRMRWEFRFDDVEFFFNHNKMIGMIIMIGLGSEGLKCFWGIGR